MANLTDALRAAILNHDKVDIHIKLHRRGKPKKVGLDVTLALDGIVQRAAISFEEIIFNKVGDVLLQTLDQALRSPAPK
jgi:hypothetical protein